MLQAQDLAQEGLQQEPGAIPAWLLATVALTAVPVVLWSEYTLKLTGQRPRACFRLHGRHVLAGLACPHRCCNAYPGVLVMLHAHAILRPSSTSILQAVACRLALAVPWALLRESATLQWEWWPCGPLHPQCACVEVLRQVGRPCLLLCTPAVCACTLHGRASDVLPCDDPDQALAQADVLGLRRL